MAGSGAEYQADQLRKGSTFKVRTKQGKEYEGVVHLLQKRMVVLEKQLVNHKKDIFFIRKDQITNVKHIKTPSKDEGPSAMLMKIDEKLLNKKETKNIKRRKEQDAKRGRGVSKQAQALFDHLYTSCPTNTVKWSKTTIQVMGTLELRSSDNFKTIHTLSKHSSNEELEYVNKSVKQFWSQQQSSKLRESPI